MFRKLHTRITLSLLCAITLSGCALEPLDDNWRKELYTRSFIKTFGVVDPEHDWNMATSAIVKIVVSDSQPSQVKIYAEHGSKYYLVADLDDVTGKIEVPVDVPKTCKDVMVKVGNRKFYGKINETIDCTVLSRAEEDEDEFGPNNNPAIPEYNKTIGDYSIKVQHTNRGNGFKSGYTSANDEYQYFNTEQIAPIVATTPWHSYYSLNTNGWSKENANNEIGLLPESGVFNRTGQTLLDWLKAKENEEHEIVKDFKINTGKDGSFTIFPFYYGTNLQHELGVYLLDDNGNPVLKEGTYDSSKVNNYTLDDFVSFPIFTDRKHGDLQIQPHYDYNITGIRLWDSDNNKEITEFHLNGVGDTYDLSKYVQIERGSGNWMSYKNYLSQFGDQYHSRVAYHIWVEDGKKPGSKEAYESDPNYDKKYGTVTHATVNKNGLVTAVYTTKPHDGGKAWGSIAIATRMENTNSGKSRVRGVSKDISYTVYTDHQDVTKITVDGSTNPTISLNVGETKTLNVQLWNKYNDELDIEKYWDDIKVTTGWGDGIWEIWKDNDKKAIKIQGLKSGTQWPKIYIGDWDSGNSEFTTGSIVCDFTVNVSCNAHAYTLNGDSWPTSGSWQNFFDTKYKTTTEETIYTPLNPNSTNPEKTWGSILISNTKDMSDKYMWDDLEPGQKIKISITPVNGNSCKIKLYTRDSTGEWSELPGFAQNQPHTSAIELTVTDNMCSAIKGCTDFIIQRCDDEGFYLNSISITKSTYSDTGNEEDKVYVWKSNGKSDAISALQTYYATSYTVDTQECTYCKESVDFSGATVDVTIPSDADYDHIKYTVTWTKSASSTPSGKPAMHKQSTTKPRAQKAPAQASRSASREAGKPAMLNNNNNWQDVSSYWTRYLPAGEEVSCYPSNSTMLARSRGYDITLKYKDDVYVGDLGMYLKVLGSNDIEDEAKDQNDNNGTVKYTEYTGANQYIVYSQRRFNKDASGRPYPQVSALSFKHPVTGRTYLSFEDMLVTHAEGTSNYDWSRALDYFFWEKSSDRDGNDMIFQITNHGGASDDEGHNVKESEEYDEGFPWIWVVEDLGSTDDFDFNDLVVRITSITKKKTKKEGEGDNITYSGSATKELTFKPLAAGGTLPLYIHFKVNGNDYVLQPGVYNISGAKIEGVTNTGAQLTKTSGSEIHSWFGSGYPSKTMINTGSGPRVSQSDINECKLYVPAPVYNAETKKFEGGFSMNIFQSSDKDGATVDNKDNISKSIHFLVEVDNITDQGNIYDDKLAQQYEIVNGDLGEAPQSFIIMGDNWRWPKERAHILSAYPDFGNWVKNKSNTSWTKTNVSTRYLYE